MLRLDLFLLPGLREGPEWLFPSAARRWLARGVCALVSRMCIMKTTHAIVKPLFLR